MDPFTQRMLEKAEQRSRALGIGNASKYPLAECTSDANVGSAANATTILPTKQTVQQQQQQPTSVHASTSTTNSVNKLQVVEKTPTTMETTTAANGSPNKVLRQFSAVDKENMDLGIEINIMTHTNVEVEVQVEEQEITDDDVMHQNQALSKDAMMQQPMANIRDASRNRLQRLGALYSNTTDLSSPIHRTEGQFHAGYVEDTELNASSKKPKQRYGKLMDLANSINQWEDDTAHHNFHMAAGAAPPPKPYLSSRRVAAGETTPGKKPKAPPPPPPTKAQEDAKDKTKQLKWDPKVINSLEAQGFQRRESSTVRLAYDYAKSESSSDEEEQRNVVQVERSPLVKNVSEKPVMSKFAATIAEEKKPLIAEKKIHTVKPGLVSGRAAVFEQKAVETQQQQKPQKDPTELSLKERMKLFEKNKGEALVPKAPFGMAPSISQIRQEQVNRRDDNKAPATISASSSNSSIASVKPNVDSKVRDKVAALVASTTTISENKIKADIHKQRQDDMQVLANRFHKQREEQMQTNTGQQQQMSQLKPSTKLATVNKSGSSSGGAKRPPPPPPPPPPSPATTTTTITRITQQQMSVINTTKRRSPGNAIDEESKRVRTNRLYPGLSDFESNEDEESLTDNDNCATTATVSEEEQKKKQKHHRCSHSTAAAAHAARDNDEDEENESYMESEADDDSSAGICNVSLGREIMQVVQRNEHNHYQQQKQQHQQSQQQQLKPIKEVHYADIGAGDSSINSSEASMGVDDYLDEALDMDGDDDYTPESEDDDGNLSRNSRASKGTTASNSFSFRKAPHTKYTSCQTINEEGGGDYETPKSSTQANGHFAKPVKSELTVNQEDENMVTLVHTVSFYRRQQNANSANTTPIRKIRREQQVLRSAVESAAQAVMQFESTPKHNNAHYANNDDDVDAATGASDDDDTQYESDVDETHLVQEKIKKLLDEVCKQQQVIAQTSQALNLCAATIEFSGSTESVEGERHLLVATHRRQACLDEVQRLRVEKSLRPLGAPKEKGRLTIKEVTIPLRQDYIRKLAADTISGHHLVCLLKYNEHVLATKTVPTLPGLLAVKFPDILQLNNVFADFKVTLEIYGMTAQREVLPHEVKYHINLNKKSGIKTPKKKGGENRLVMPPVQSPAGPNVVRTPALVQYGFAIFSLREIQRTTWTLTQVLGVCPLDGAVHMKVNCELSVSVDYKGFLTMFEDISGFGAWHRRWCHLNGTVLNYWKYPDDEKKKAPMGTIDLYACSSQKITIAPRDICARLNTMLLECQRPALNTDQESLIIVPNGRVTTVRCLLSADTKEEREEWCACFNKALTLMRAWGPPQ